MIPGTFRMSVRSSSSRMKASLRFKGVEVMEGCSQRPAETHVVHGPGQLKQANTGWRFSGSRKSGPASGPGADPHLELFVCGEPEFLQQD